jgi:NTP pyrophosphatase (non-canonical NTP hydrolase)
MKSGNRPINEWYVEWANTLDSAGEDSGPARGRLVMIDTMTALMHTFGVVAVAGRAAGDLKKYIYYGDVNRFQDTFKEVIYPDPPEENLEMYDALHNTFKDEHELCRLLHGILGLVDEAAEMMEALYKHIANGTELDVTNIREEAGDSQWYMAIIAKFLGDPNFDAIHEANFRKLVARYPDKEWKQEHALDTNRDKEAERKAIDNNGLFPPVPKEETQNMVYLARSFNPNNQKVWVMFNKDDTIYGKTTDTKLSLIRKWKKKCGPDIQWTLVTFTGGIMRRSELIAAIVDVQETKDAKG